MKKAVLILAMLGLLLPLTLAQADNGAPNGAHYNLNLIGVAKDKTATMDGSSGHTIFVPLWRNTTIKLTEGEFQVLDRNGTDGNGAAFQLPNPDPDGDGTTVYSVYARALGKPFNNASVQTCATDPVTLELMCSVAVLTLERTKGPSKFENVSKQLLYIYADIDADGIQERVPLFSDELQDYFWAYDNNGLKLVQLRFYEVPTTVPAPATLSAQ
jgi:hypothetical protein